MTTIVVLTPRVVADSRRLRPLRRSLTSLSFVSSLVLSYLSSDGVSLSTTRVAAVTPSCARVHLRHVRRTLLCLPLQSRYPHGPPYRSLCLSFTSIGYYIFHRNEGTDTARPTTAKPICRCTYGRARTRVWVHRIRGGDGGGVGVRVGRREVGDGTRDTSLGREREGQREWGTHGLPSFLRVPPSCGTLSSLRIRTSCAFSLFLLYSLHSVVPASHSRIVRFSISFDYARYHRRFSCVSSVECRLAWQKKRISGLYLP